MMGETGQANERGEQGIRQDNMIDAIYFQQPSF